VQASMSSYDQTLTDLLYRTHANCRVPRLAPLSGISSDHSWRLKVGAAVKFQHDRIPGQLRRAHDARLALEQAAVPVENVR
jgi:hypothetical protein